MYEAHFDLAAKPFSIVPNPEILFLSKNHENALTYLEYGLSEKVGFILLTGEIGSGKTTLITQGGFAETFNEALYIQRKILRDYLDLIIYRDLVDRHNIKNRSLLKHLIKYSFSNIGTLVSFNKLYNEYKSLGYRVSKDTLYNYFTYLEDAYALFTVPIFRNSVREEMRNPRKLYSIDTGFKTLFETSRSPDFSKLYENLVFLHLRRKTDQIAYYKQNREVDFYCRHVSPALINVSYDISNPSTRQREISALEEGMAYFHLKEALLLTRDIHETVSIGNGTITIQPLYEWLVSG